MSHIRLCIIGDCLIEVDGAQITPSASHLFGLLLILAIENKRWLSRREIQDLLFVESATTERASHSLRQLLYRIRQMAVRFEERPPQGHDDAGGGVLGVDMRDDVDRLLAGLLADRVRAHAIGHEEDVAGAVPLLVAGRPLMGVVVLLVAAAQPHIAEDGIFDPLKGRH